MSANLKVKVRASGLEGMPVVVEIIPFDSGKHVRSLQVIIGSDDLISDLDKGRYSVRARLPNGAFITSSVTVTGDGQESVDLNAVPETFSRGVRRRYHTFRDFERRSWSEKSLPPFVDGVLISSSQEHLLEIIAWKLAPDALDWRELEPMGKPQTAEPDSIMYKPDVAPDIKVDLPQGLGSFLTVKNPWHSRLWLSRVPRGSTEARVTANPVPGVEGTKAEFQPKFKIDDLRSESLLGYLRRGSLRDARLVGEELMGAASEMLRGKFNNYSGAAVAGYFLMKTTPPWESGNVFGGVSAEDLREWLHNLDFSFPNSADGAITNGTSLLRDGEFAKSRARFLEAERRGPPEFSLGIRMLVDGLMFFSSKADDGEAAVALSNVRAWANHVDWERAVTSISGYMTTSGTGAAKFMPGTPQ